MHTRPATITTLLTIVATAAACSAAGHSTTLPSGQTDGADPRGQPPVVHVAGHDLATPAPEADTEMTHASGSAPTDPADHAAVADPVQVADPAGIDDPADVAAGLLIDLLADEGLLVTSIDTLLESGGGDQAQVRVDVAHSPGHGHPVQSRYLLDLVRDAGRWRLAGFSEPG